MRRLLFVPAVLIALWSIGSTAYSMVDVATLETIDETETFATADAVVLDTDAGSATVVADRTSGIVVDLERRQGVKTADASAELDAEGRVVVRTRCSFGIGVVCRVKATIHVPRGTPVTGGGASIRITDVGGPVDLASTNDTISVTGAEGAVTLRTTNGRLSVYDSSGPLELRTGNGSIDVDGVDASEADVATSNGDVRLAFSNAPDRITATSSNGRVGITLPADAPAYAVNASTSLGSTDIGIRTDPGADRTIAAATSTGSISINYR